MPGGQTLARSLFIIKKKIYGRVVLKLKRAALRKKDHIYLLDIAQAI